jgi:hypothetical protein
MNRSRLTGLAAIAILTPIAATGWATAPAQPDRAADRSAERTQPEHVPVIASRFARPVTANEARTLKTEEDTALAVAEAAAHDMDVLAHTVPERRLARNELATLHAIRPLIQRRQQLRQTFIRLGAKPVLAGVAVQPKTTGPKPGTRTTGAGGGTIASAAGGDGQGALISATHQMQETQMSFNLQYLQLQSAMQAPSLKTAAISDILKTKHDTVKNVIGNIR